MRMTEDHAFLKNVFLFSGLDDSQIKRIASLIQKKRFLKGQIIFTECDPARSLHILKEGKVKIFRVSSSGKEQILHFINEGEVFGEVAAFLSETYPASACAQKESIVLSLPIEEFYKILKTDPKIAMNMLAILCLRLKEFVHIIDGLALKDVAQRLSAYLLFASEKKEKTIELGVKKSELASFLGTVPETISRVLSKMSKEGIIAMKKNLIEIKKPKELERIATGERFFTLQN